VFRTSKRFQAPVSPMLARFCCLLAFIGVPLLGVVPPAFAQTVFDQNGFGANHDSYTVLPYEYVDPLSGNLILVVNDLTLPGNAGMNLSIQRVYNSAVYPNYKNGGDKTLEEDSWAGIGWRLHFGRVLHENDGQQTQIELPDGSRHPLYHANTSDGWTTKEFWVYNKSTHMLKLPNGVVYTFGRSVYLMLNGMLQNVQYVTEMRDPFNNVISFTYFDASGPPDGVAQIHQDLGQGQSRDVTFTYDPTLRSLQSMSYNGMTWTYTQQAFGPSGYSKLTGVQPPAGLPWGYDYLEPSGYALTQMNVPGGGTVNYTYGEVNRVAGSTTELAHVVVQRSIGGARITPGTWTFQYSQGPNQDTSIVSCPCGTTSYRYNAIGVNGTFNAWLSGTLAERTVSDSSGTLEDEQLTWQPSELISSDAIPPTNGLWSDTAVFGALLTRRVVTRGTHTWTTDLEYDRGHGTFNDYGRPFRVTSHGELTRVITSTFQYDFIPYIVDRVASQSVQIGPEIVTSSSVYDRTTGFQTSRNVLGVVTTFAPTAQGHVGVVTDANGHQTTFHYQWGVVSDTITPRVNIGKTIDPSGVVLAQTIGSATTSLTTRYVYDAGLRLKTVQPPGANSIGYSYDDLYQGWIRIARDQAQTSYQLDGFGRVVQTSNRVNLLTTTTRDACGRATFQSAPFTTGPGTRGGTTQYDALNRVTQITEADGTSVTRFTYDGAGVHMTDPEGRQTFQNYDAFGDAGDARLTWVQDAKNTITRYTYDVLGHLTKVSGPGAVPDRTWVYNGKGWLDHETQPEKGTTSYLYDAVGNVTQVTDALGQVTTLAYDFNNRLISRDAPGLEADATFTYDDIGRLTKQQSPSMVTNFTYDTAGRIATKAENWWSASQWFQSSYAYDANDNLTQLTYPFGRVVTYAYDIENRLLSIQQNGAAFANNFAYDDSGRLASYVTGAVTHAVTYDTRDRISHLTAGVSGGPSAIDLTYHYSPVSHITAIEDSRPSMGQTFGYDTLDRLKSANGPYGALAWTYDDAGNRLTGTRDGGTTAYTYDPSTLRLTGTTGASAETFTYNAIGQLTGDQYGTYSYLPNGVLRHVDGPASGHLTADYYSDVDGQRIIRRVTDQNTYNQDVYTFRSASGQVLSEVVNQCNATASTRDLIYAGTLLIGAVKNSLDVPRVYFDRAAWALPENSGTAWLTVWIVTPTGTPLGCSVTVSYETPAGTPPGTAQPGTNYAATRGTLTFPAGTPSGTYLRVGVPLMDDGINGPDKTFTTVLTNALGARIVEPSAVATTLQNVDAPPTLTVSDVTVNEAAGQAVFTLNLSRPSAYDIQVTYYTYDETAHAGYDYTALNSTLTIPAGSASATIVVPVTDDSVAEPTESFLLRFSNVVNATLTNPNQWARALILDNDGTRVPIDSSLPGNYFADGTAVPGYDDYIIIGNRHAVNVTARLTFTRNDGTGTTRDVVIPASGRLALHVADEPGIGTGEVSMVVQSTDPAHPLDADHSVYWGSGWQAGRSTEGVSPSQVWYFAEGSTGYFEEYLTLFNPSPAATDVWLGFYSTGGAIYGTWQHIEPGPGRTKIRVRDLIGNNDHGIRIWAYTPIVAERTMTWQLGADEREGHSTPGTNTGSTTWYFAEGDTGFDTYLALLNLDATPAHVQIDYLHANGTAYSSTVDIPAYARATVHQPSWLPAGSFGMRITSVNGQSLVAERSMYGGTNWTLGTGGVGTPTLSTLWYFEEGATGAFWDTYILLANPSGTTANVSIAFVRDDGGVYWANVQVAPNQRQSVLVDAVPGVTAANFRTEVHSDTPIVAERATYWPGSSGSAALAASLTSTTRDASSSATTTSASEPSLGFNPYTTRQARPQTVPTRYHTVTEGDPGGDRERALAAQSPDPTADSSAAPAAATSGTTTATPAATINAVSGGWYGAHLTGGRHP
jgi:YD repeat-containing protein